MRVAPVVPSPKKRSGAKAVLLFPFRSRQGDLQAADLR